VPRPAVPAHALPSDPTNATTAGRGRAAWEAGQTFEAALDHTHRALAARAVPIAIARAHPPVGGDPRVRVVGQRLPALHYTGDPGQ
jgi:hypothetical protein